jgi:methionyl-tRNA formyltransferase
MDIMRVLVLGPESELLEKTFNKKRDVCISRSAYFEVSDWPIDVEWVVSFGYRKIIPRRLIEKFGNKIINIHCSALPYNRGASPNFWSWFDGTPNGVTIHRVTEGLDAGPILAQQLMYEDDFREKLTLFSTYNDLLVAASGLFAASWPAIRDGALEDKRFVAGEGSYHQSGEEDKFMRFLPLGWHTPIQDVKTLGSIYRKAARK